MKLLSIVTVCYDAEETLQFTIDSLKNQKTAEVEYIIIDGFSKDSTCKIIKKNKDVIDITISEADHGLYDAMNKGASLSSGKYLMFLNADDTLKENSIELILKQIKYKKFDIIYGIVELSQPNSDFKRNYLDINYNKFKSYFFLTPPHPGFIMKSSLLNKIGGFDINYSLASDFDMQLKAWKYSKSYKRLNLPLVQMSLGGVSNSSFRNRLIGFTQLISSYAHNNSPIFTPLILVRYIYKVAYLMLKK
jgi:glycosyltransferase involved in cell wall biosynthesis